MYAGQLFIHADERGKHQLVRIVTSPSPSEVLVRVQFLGSRENMRVRRQHLTPAVLPETDPARPLTAVGRDAP
jgi:hypothetical protein